MSESGLTVQQAIAEVAALDAPPEEKVEATPAQEIEAAPSAETSEEPEGEPTDDVAENDEPEEAEQAEPAAVEPPRFWDKEAKEAFLALPANLQAIVVAKEAERDKATSVALQKAAEGSKKSEQEASRFATIAANMDKSLAEAGTAFTSKWGNGEIDWNKVAEEHGADQAFKLKNDFDRDQRIIQQMQSAKNEADTIQTGKFVSERFETLKTVEPELTEDGKGPERQLELVNYLSGFGVNRDVIIKRASAQELAIGYKAMKWDQAQAKAKTAATAPKPAAQGPRMTVRPTASVASGSQETAKLKALRSAFDKNPSRENLIALQIAEG